MARRNFLGPIIDYRVTVGGCEVRVQQDTREALERNLIFEEGASCGLTFLELQWYDSDGTEEGVRP